MKIKSEILQKSSTQSRKDKGVEALSPHVLSLLGPERCGDDDMTGKSLIPHTATEETSLFQVQHRYHHTTVNRYD